MIDQQILEQVIQHHASHTAFANRMGVTLPTLSNWKQRGIPARWRPTVWALLERHCPETAAKLDRDVFFDVRITGDAA